MSDRQLPVVMCAVLLFVAASCTRPSTQEPSDKGSTAPVANSVPLVRVSSEEVDAAEPTIAAARDGSVYVAWVEHRNKDADVMLKHFNREGQPA